MGLTGIQILKYLPKTNCKECGFATCLSFAMKVASLQAEIEKCPYIDPKIKEEIAETISPPIKTVSLKTPEKEFLIGGEIVLFRHEKKFFNPPLIGTYIAPSMSKEEVTKRLNFYKNLRWERIGNILRPEIVCIKEEIGLQKEFLELVEKVCLHLRDVAIMLEVKTPEVTKQAIQILKDFKPLVYVENLAEKFNIWKEILGDKQITLGIKGNFLDELIELSEMVRESGFKEVVLDSGALHPKELLEDLIIMRRLAIKKKYKPLGFPVIVFMDRYFKDVVLEYVLAGMCIAKYASIILVSELRPELLFPLLLQRFNLYSDPQKPLIVDEGIYPVNGPDAYSPVIITCNFALTYFIVSGEVENSRVPTWILVKNTDGLSVLTAWAAGKFNADNIAEFVKNCGIEEKVAHRVLMIPGYVGSIKGELEEELKDWEVVVGPREANGLPQALKKLNEKLKNLKNN